MSNVISRIRSTGQSIRVRRRKLRKLVDSILTLISRCCLFSASGHWCCSSKFTLFWPTSLLLLASAKPWHSSAAAEHRRTESNPCLYCEARGLKLKPLAIRIEVVAFFLPRSLQRLRNAVTIPRSLRETIYTGRDGPSNGRLDHNYNYIINENYYYYYYYYSSSSSNTLQ